MDNLDLSNPSNQAIKEAAEIAKEFISKLIYPATDEVGGILEDNVKYWRFKNKVNLVLKAKKFLEDKHIDPKKILPKNLIPILENGSLEEDPAIQDMWAKLLASYAKGNVEIQSYPSILKELSSVEVKILERLYIERKKSNLKGRDLVTHGFTKKDISKTFEISNNKYDIITDNLFRLNLIQPVGSSGSLVGSFPVSIKTKEIVYITDLGFDLVRMCSEFSHEETPTTSDANLTKGPEQDNIPKWG
jgi:hypothetical protein